MMRKTRPRARASAGPDQRASAEASSQTPAATSADAGIVRIHAQTIVARDAPAHGREPARRADADDRARDRVRRRDRDAAEDAPKSVTAPADSAQKPPTGWSCVIRIPIVRTIRQPPESVPRPIAAWQTRTIQNGISSGLQVARRERAAPR